MSTNLEYTEKEKVSENNFTFQQQQQRNVQKNVFHLQNCCFCLLIRAIDFFLVLVAISIEHYMIFFWVSYKYNKIMRASLLALGKSIVVY